MCGQKNNLIKSGRIRRDRLCRFLPDVAGFSREYPAQSGTRFNAGFCHIPPDFHRAAETARTRALSVSYPCGIRAVSAHDPLTTRSQRCDTRWANPKGNMVIAPAAAASTAILVVVGIIGIVMKTTIISTSNTTTSTTASMMTDGSSGTWYEFIFSGNEKIRETKARPKVSRKGPEK